MGDERILRIIEELERVRGRRMLFMGDNSSSAAGSFLCGFDCACMILGLHLPYEMRQQATEERGWPLSAEAWSVSAMRERGLTDEAIADEMIAINIGAWRHMAGESVARNPEDVR